MKKYLLSILLLSFYSLVVANSGFLGITIKNYQNKETKGIQITEAIKNGAAQLQGLIDNDIITHINGTKVETKEALSALVASFPVGETIKVDYIRNDKSESKKIKLGEKPMHKDYSVQIKKLNTEEQWIFTDDKSTIIVKNNIFDSYIYTDAKGVVNTISLKNYDNSDISTKLADLEAKISVVNSLKKGQASCNCNCNFYKHRYFNFPEPTKTVENKAEESKVVLITEKFNVFPNPTSGEFVLDFATKEQGTAFISILDVTGKVITTQRIQNFEGTYTNKFDLKDEARGMYIVQIKVGEKLATSKILLK